MTGSLIGPFTVLNAPVAGASASAMWALGTTRPTRSPGRVQFDERGMSMSPYVASRSEVA
jgi:hypothetical protein